MNMIVKTSDLVGFEAENQNKIKLRPRYRNFTRESKQANKAKKIGGWFIR